MAYTVAGAVEVYVTMTETSTDDIGSQDIRVSSSPQISNTYTAGTGNNQINWYYQKRYTISAGGNQDIDFASGITDKDGAAIVATAIKVLLIKNRSASYAGYLDSSVAASITSLFEASTTDKISFKPSGCVFMESPLAGYAVTATTADVLRIHNSGAGSMDVDVFAAGVQ